MTVSTWAKRSTTSPPARIRSTSPSIRPTRCTYLGSAIGFRTIFPLAADRAKPAAGRSFDERLSDGFGIVVEDVKTANWHIHQVLYGLIEAMMEDAMGGPLGEPPEVTNIPNAPAPDIVGLPPWIDIASMKS